MTAREAALRGRKPPRRLINHREIAALFGTSARTWRRWSERGVVPLPHQVIGTLLLYDRDVIDHRLEHGTWPPGVRFKAPAASRTPPSADATPPGSRARTAPSS